MGNGLIMLKIIQKDNLLYLTEQERTEYDLENTTLVHTLPGLHYDENLKGTIRPFRALWLKKKEMYKLDLLNYLPDILYSGYTPTPTSLEEHRRTVRDVGGVALMMGLDKIDVSEDYDILYECDTWNSIEDSYGPKTAEMFKEYYLLTSQEQDLIKKVWAAGDLRGLEVARSGDWENIVNFLPQQTRSELLIFGGSETEVGSEKMIPEFRRKEQLGPQLPNLKELVYQEFKLGEFLLEGAQEVKDRLGEIYKECGINKNPKAKDLEDWFIVTPCRCNGRRGFRIDFRKENIWKQ